MFFLVASLAGCAPTQKVEMPTLVADYNANAVKAPQLWSRAKIAVTIPRPIGSFTWGSTSVLASNNGYLVLFKNGVAGPHDFVLIGKENVAEIFRLGSSTEEGVYYLWFKAGNNSGAWIGRLDATDLRHGGDMPFDPNEFLSALGIMELPTSATPTVKMHIGGFWEAPSDRFAYVLTQPLPTGKREMYFDWPQKISDPRPLKKVVLYDKANHPTMTARLSSYQTIADANGAQMPTEIVIDWGSANGRTTTLALALSEMTAREKAQRSIVTLTDHMPDIPPDKINHTGATRPPGETHK
jgi:hypothetical protein